MEAFGLDCLAAATSKACYEHRDSDWAFLMPIVLRFDGFKFHFYSNEGNPREPAHIHVRKGRDEAKFWLTPTVVMAYNDGFDARTFNRIQRLVEQHREQLERAWHEYFA